MRGIFGTVVAVLLLTGSAAAEPGSGPRETVDQTYTVTAPDSPTGLRFTASYHAADDPQSPPPAMRRMVFYPPAGFRLDTSVPGQCTATDAQLELQGPAACPANSRIGWGTTEGLFFVPFDHSTTFDRFKHDVDVMNNANEQIILVHSEGWTVVRGKMNPDNSLEFTNPTCFPAPPAGSCPDDYLIQLGTTSTIPVHAGSKGSYATTPPTCPATGYWETTVRFWWADDTSDSVVSRQPCA